MTDTETRSQQRSKADEDVSKRLLESADTLSYDPAVEVDWDSPLPGDLYGLNPEWSTLYGTPLWDEMTSGQKVALTRHEVGSIMSTGIWFEMILQQMVLRDQYVKNPVNPQFRFALTEIADECRHSIMFARACEKMGVPAYLLPRRRRTGPRLQDAGNRRGRLRRDTGRRGDPRRDAAGLDAGRGRAPHRADHLADTRRGGVPAHEVRPPADA